MEQVLSLPAQQCFICFLSDSKVLKSKQKISLNLCLIYELLKTVLWRVFFGSSMGVFLFSIRVQCHCSLWGLVVIIAQLSHIPIRAQIVFWRLSKIIIYSIHISCGLYQYKQSSNNRLFCSVSAFREQLLNLQDQSIVLRYAHKLSFTHLSIFPIYIYSFQALKLKNHKLC